MKPTLILAGLLLALTGNAAEIRWEAESTTNTDLTTAGPYHPKDATEAAQLSGGKWLNGKYDKSGGFADYAVEVAAAGRYQLFARKFWQHGPFRWRFDAGNWYQLKEAKLLEPAVMRPNVPVCWAKLGNVTLAAGPHTFRIELISDPAYAWSTVFGLDCFVLTTEPYLGCTVTNAEPPAYVPVAQLKTGPGLDDHGIPVEPDQAQFGRHLPRTLALLAGSSPTQRNQLRILFYGQSIVASSAVQAPVVAALKDRFPNAILKVENRAIGGYMAPRLCRTAWHDLYPVYPDLVVFHVYGGEDDGTLEEIFRNIRQFTTAEVLTWTDHEDALGQGAYRDRAATYRRQLAEKYGFELAEVRDIWKKYLAVQALPTAALLADQIHLNSRGGELLSRILMRHFQVPAPPAGDWTNCIRSVMTGASTGIVLTAANQKYVLKFKGNRVDLIGQAVGRATGTAKVLVDGQPPSADPRGYAATRPSVCPGGWWPALNHVVLGEQVRAETWTLAMRDIKSADDFSFELIGSVTGPDGVGRSGTPFVSKSGHIKIAPQDFALKESKTLPASFAITWRTYQLGRDDYKADAQTETRLTVFQQLESAEHVLELVPNGDGPVPVRIAQVYAPEYTVPK